MDRFFLTLLFLFSFATTAVAEFGPRAWGPSTKLIYVSPTELRSETGIRSLCVQVEDQHAFYIPYRRVVSGYVLSSTECTTPQVTAAGHSVVARMKAAGLMPATVPDTPTVPLNVSLRSQIVVLVLALAFCAVPWLLRRRMSPMSRRMRQVSGDPLFFDALLSLMFHVARTDGVIAKAELQTIRDVYHELTGSKVTAEMTATHFASFTSNASILRLVREYRDLQAETLLDASILVATHDGCIPREKKTFLTDLNTALDCETKWFDRALAEALCPEARAAKLSQTGAVFA